MRFRKKDEMVQQPDKKNYDEPIWYALQLLNTGQHLYIDFSAITACICNFLIQLISKYIS